MTAHLPPARAHCVVAQWAARPHAFVRLRPTSVHVGWLMEVTVRVLLASPARTRPR